MGYVKISFWIFLAAAIFGLFHYTLPQYDVVRITNTEVRRIDFGRNAIFWASPDLGSDATVANRDVRFIEGFYENGKPMVFRNEDTGFGWPPYFKLNSSNLQAKARDLVSTKDAPRWVMITHYGWRNDLISIYPNAVRLKPVSGPDVRIIPWLNIVILLALAVGALLVRRAWKRFWVRRVDPVLEDIGEATDAARNRAKGIVGWLKSWRG